MLPFDSDIFQSAAAVLALQKYAAVTHLSVRLYDERQRIIAPPTGSNHLMALFSGGREPQIASKCVDRCFSEEARPACVCVENEDGLAVVGAPMTHDVGLFVSRSLVTRSRLTSGRLRLGGSLGLLVYHLSLYGGSCEMSFRSQ